jgi:hypothetical protein
MASCGGATELYVRHFIIAVAAIRLNNFGFLLTFSLTNGKAASSIPTFDTHLRSFRMNNSFKGLLDINRGHFLLE